MSTLDRFPPPYLDIGDLFNRGEVVPFLGAGASLPVHQPQESDPLANLPTGIDLGYRLAKRIGISKEEVNINNLIEIASCYALMTGRLSLEEELEREFGTKQGPGSLHYLLA